MDLLGGIMGPIIFLSLVTSINLPDNLDEFNNLGIRIFKRFALIALFITLVVVAVSAVLFNTLRNYDADLDLGLAIQLLLDVIPTSIVDPFVNNDMPQLVVLGVLMGVSLVLLGDRVKGLATNLEQVEIWANEFMSIVLKLSLGALPERLQAGGRRGTSASLLWAGNTWRVPISVRWSAWSLSS